MAAFALAGTGLLNSAAQSGPITAQPATGAPLAGLTRAELERFFIGREAFARDLTIDEGLGPIFNQTACGDCHITPLGGTGTTKVLRAGHQTKGGFDPLEEFGGSLFQLESINKDCAEAPPPQANVFTDRVTNGMTGYGLVEAILDSDIQAVKDAQNPATIRGVAHMVSSFEDEVMRVGRFGWKAQVATLLTFSADAGLQEMGLTNRFLMEDNDPNGIDPPTLAECDTVADPEDSVAMGNGVDREFIDVVTDFQRFMTQPPQTPRSGMTGEILFNTIGCADCHRKTYITSDAPALEAALRNKTIHPYGDFLLHHIGGLADNIQQGDAGIGQMKTAPLAGIRTRDPIIHDGRVAGFFFSDRIEIAVAYHCYKDSQARTSAQLFLNGLEPQFCGFDPEIPPCPDCAVPPKGGLTDDERTMVIDFLASLGRREFNHADVNDIDDDVEMDDFIIFASCFFGDGPYTPDDLCAIDDVDGDGDVDEVDFDVFLTVYSGPQTDCNGNGVLDLIDIINGTSKDANGDGVPDECCVGDIDGDGDVGVKDLLDLLGAWGPNPLHPADFNGDGSVGVSDLLTMLANWGTCP